MSRVFFAILTLTILVIAGCAKPSTPPDEPATQTSTGTTQGKSRGEVTTETPQEDEESGPLVLTTDQIFTLPAADAEGDHLTVEEIQSFLDDPENHKPFLPAVPLGLSDVADQIPSDNPLTRAKVELGRQLYFDPRLSRDSSVSCASCHDPAMGWAQDTAVATGIGSQKGGRNSPTVMNRVYGETQFWDGRAASLEEQALGPIQNPIEMGHTLDGMIEGIKGIEGYRLQFEEIFGEVSSDGIADAIAGFERTVLVGNAPFDFAEELKRFEGLEASDLEEDAELAARYEKIKQGADTHPMSEAAGRGRELFFSKRVACSLCHVGANLTSEEFFNIGVGMDAEQPDLGRFEVTGDEKDKGAFKTPTLRNIALTAPYMHDGSQSTLEVVVDFYAKGGHPNDHLHERIQKIDLTDEEKQDLVAFLREGLSGELPPIARPRLPEE